MALTPLALTAWGFTGAMAAFAVVSVASAAAFFAFCPARQAQGGPEESAAIDRGFWQKAREPQFLLLFFVSFLGLGYFNGFTSWIEAILATNSINSEQAGIIGGVLIAGGIFGSALIPAAAVHLKRRKPILLASVFISALTLVPLCRSADYTWLLLWGFLQGFFFLPAYALLLDLTALRAGARYAGSATGVLMLAGNAGGVIVILTMGVLKGDAATFPSALPFLGALLVVAILAAIGAEEPLAARI
jgi:cyanate permease